MNQIWNYIIEYCRKMVQYHHHQHLNQRSLSLNVSTLLIISNQLIYDYAFSMYYQLEILSKMYQNRGNGSQSAIVYQKRANQLSPKIPNKHKLNPVYNSDFHQNANQLSDGSRWGKMPNEPSSVEIERKSSIYKYRENQNGYEKHNYEQRQIVRNSQWENQRSKISKINKKLEDEAKLKQYNRNHIITNQYSPHQYKQGDRKRKHKIFERTPSCKGSKIGNSDLKKSYGSFDSKSNHRYGSQKQITQHRNPVYKKIINNKAQSYKSKSRLISSTQHLQTPVRYQQVYRNPHSIRNHQPSPQHQHFRPDAPIIISYSNPTTNYSQTHPNLPTVQYNKNPYSSYQQNFPQTFQRKPIAQQQMISPQIHNQVLPKYTQHLKPNNQPSQPMPSKWNMNTDSKLSELVNRPIIYRSMQIPNQTPTYPQYDKIRSTQRKDIAPISSKQRNSKSGISNSGHNQPNNREYDKNDHNRKESDDQDSLHNDFYDFSPRKLKQRNSNAQSATNSKADRISNILLSPNMKRQHEQQEQCDRFFDMDFNQIKHKNSVQEQEDWLTINKSGRSDIVSPLQHKFDQINQRMSKKSSQNSQIQVKKQKDGMAKKVMGMFSNADTQGKVITLILVGIGLLLVFLQACK